MKQVTFTAVAEVAYGKKLAAPIKYEVSYSAYENFAELVSANDALTNDEQVRIRNVERKVKERQAQQALAFTAAGIVKPDIHNNEQLRLRKMAELYESNGLSASDAQEAASAALGIEWQD